jgi:branched-chain amino acid transport system ATP-binding protein
MSQLATRDIVKQFGGVRAVDAVNASFDAGKITALIGPNGSGKTTLINTLSGMLSFDSGTVIVSDSVQLSKLRAADVASYGITRTFQQVRLFPQMTVLDNILVVLTERSVWAALFERHTMLHLDAAQDVLKRVGLFEKRHAKVEELSFGQRKLLEVARAISMRATIYFFDEPFAGLFVEMRTILSSILRDLKHSGAAVVLVEHDMALVRGLADHCFVLDSGKLIAEGTIEDVLKEARVIDAYLGK